MKEWVKLELRAQAGLRRKEAEPGAVWSCGSDAFFLLPKVKWARSCHFVSCTPNLRKRTQQVSYTWFLPSFINRLWWDLTIVRLRVICATGSLQIPQGCSVELFCVFVCLYICVCVCINLQTLNKRAGMQRWEKMEKMFSFIYRITTQRTGDWGSSAHLNLMTAVQNILPEAVSNP